MDDPTEPRRWADGGGPPGMEELLRTARKTKPTITEVRRIGETLGVQGSGTFSGLTLSGGVIALVVATAIGGVAARGRFSTSSEMQTAANKPAHFGTVPASVSELEPVKAETSADDVKVPSDSVTNAPEKAAPRVRIVAAKPTELELLRGARNEIATRPKIALTYLSRHKQLYPSGILSEEREALTIAAYRALGKSATADKQAEAFRESFPGSPHEAGAKPSSAESASVK